MHSVALLDHFRLFSDHFIIFWFFFFVLIYYCVLGVICLKVCFIHIIYFYLYFTFFIFKFWIVFNFNRIINRHYLINVRWMAIRISSVIDYLPHLFKWTQLMTFFFLTYIGRLNPFNFASINSRWFGPQQNRFVLRPYGSLRLT